MLDWDSHRYLEAYLTVPLMGAVLQTANFRLSAPQLQYALDHSGAEILLVYRDCLPLIEPLLASLPMVRAVIVLMDGEAQARTLLAEATPVTEFRDFDENVLAATFYLYPCSTSMRGACRTWRRCSG